MEENPSLFSLSLDSSTKTQLSGAALWARILAIAGIVSLLIIVVSTILTTNGFLHFSETAEGDKVATSFVIGTIIGTVILIIIPLFALIFLLRFSNAMKRALEADDQPQLNTSFQNLKIYFRYLGILTLIFVVLMVLSFVLKIAGNIN